VALCKIFAHDLPSPHGLSNTFVTSLFAVAITSKSTFPLNGPLGSGYFWKIVVDPINWKNNISYILILTFQTSMLHTSLTCSNNCRFVLMYITKIGKKTWVNQRQFTKFAKVFYCQFFLLYDTWEVFLNPVMHIHVPITVIHYCDTI